MIPGLPHPTDLHRGDVDAVFRNAMQPTDPPDMDSTAGDAESALTPPG